MDNIYIYIYNGMIMDNTCIYIYIYIYNGMIMDSIYIYICNDNDNG